MQALCLYSQIRRLPLGACFIYWKGVLDMSFSSFTHSFQLSSKLVGIDSVTRYTGGKHSQNILFGQSVTGPVLPSPKSEKLETLGSAQWDYILPFLDTDFSEHRKTEEICLLNMINIVIA